MFQVENNKMTKRQIKFSQTVAVSLLLTSTVSYAEAEETIIQQEKITFQKCLKVITVSENKLSVAAEIEDISDQKRVASFKLTDGTLTITCDEAKGNITVSTNTN